jgi:predicted MFS family arabinose efflux permease
MKNILCNGFGVLFLLWSISTEALVSSKQTKFRSSPTQPFIKPFRQSYPLRTTHEMKHITVDDNLEISGITVPRTTWQPFSLLMLSQFILFIGVGAVIPTIPLYGKEIGLSGASNGLVVSAPALALLLLAKASGNFADKARRPAMLWGMLIIAISDFGTALASSIVPLVIARFGLGAGRCLSESGERGYATDLINTVPELRGRANAIQQAILALAIAIGAPIGGAIVEMYGPRASFLCVTAAALTSLFLYSFLPDTVVETDETFAKKKWKPSDRKNMSLWRELLKNSQWKGLCIFEVGVKFGYAAKLTSIPIIASSVLPGGALGAGSLLSAAGLSGLIGAPLGGILVDRYGAKTTIILTGLASSVGLMLIPFALGFTDNLLFPTWLAFSICVLIWSTSAAAQNPSITAFAQELAPSGYEATAMALPRACGDAVYLIAPFSLGFISDLDNIPAGFECFFAGFCGLIGAIVFVIL